MKRSDTKLLKPVTKTVERELDDAIIVGIDIGPKNMGLCVFDGSKRNDGTDLPYMEHSTLFIGGEGYGYRKYEEGNCTEMVYRWVQDRWESIFKRCDLVIIEKQMDGAVKQKKGEKLNITALLSKQKYTRSCIMVEQNLKAFFHAQLPHGGPKYICKGPAWWKNHMDVTYGQVNADKNGDTHKNNKKSSEQKFKEVYGVDVYKKLKKNRGPKIDDCIDAFWIAKSGYVERETMMKEALKTSHHHFKWDQTTINVPVKERRVPLRPITETFKRVLSLRDGKKMVSREIVNNKIRLSQRKKK